MTAAATMSLRPSVVVCAWCTRSGGASGAVRAPDSDVWRRVALAAVRAYEAAGGVSHGICQWCRTRIMHDWRHCQEESPGHADAHARDADAAPAAGGPPPRRQARSEALSTIAPQVPMMGGL